MAHEEVDDLAVDPDRHVPVALAREAENREFRRRVPVGRGRRSGIVGKARARHVFPQELLERPDPVEEDRVARVDAHPELPLEEPETERVVGAAHDAVVVEVEPRGDARVRGRHVAIGVLDGRRAVLRDGQVVVLEELRPEALRVEVQLVDQQDVGARPLDDLGDRLRLGIVRRREVGEELPGEVPVERRVERREADVAGAVAEEEALQEIEVVDFPVGTCRGGHRAERQRGDEEESLRVHARDRRPLGSRLARDRVNVPRALHLPQRLTIA